MFVVLSKLHSSCVMYFVSLHVSSLLLLAAEVSYLRNGVLLIKLIAFVMSVEYSIPSDIR